MKPYIQVCMDCKMDECRPDGVRCEYKRKFGSFTERTVMQRSCGFPDRPENYGGKQLVAAIARAERKIRGARV